MKSIALVKASHARSMLGVVVTFGILFAGTSAKATCDPGRGGIGASAPLALIANASIQNAATSMQKTAVAPSIVGLWQVTYTSEGTLFYQAYDTWHSDGTEIENADVSPIEGNVCMGVWKKVGTRTVHLNHVGWSFDGSGNPNGNFTLTENNVLSGDGASYQGTFDYKFFDLTGTMVQEIKGTLTATRISAD